MQLKKLLEMAVSNNNTTLSQTESDRDAVLKNIGNIVHDSVVVSKDEVSLNLSWYVVRSLMIVLYFLTIRILC